MVVWCLVMVWNDNPPGDLGVLYFKQTHIDYNFLLVIIILLECWAALDVGTLRWGFQSSYATRPRILERCHSWACPTPSLSSESMPSCLETLTDIPVRYAVDNQKRLDNVLRIWHTLAKNEPFWPVNMVTISCHIDWCVHKSWNIMKYLSQFGLQWA